MRKKELKLVATFPTTADAIAMEKYCKMSGVSGRLIPVPRSISAGCGMAWCTDIVEREHIENVAEQHGIKEEIHECMV